MQHDLHATRFGLRAQPVSDGLRCDQCYARHVIPERARRILESDTKREGTPCIAAGRDRLSLPRTRAGGARSRERIQSRQFRLIDLIAAVLLAVH